MSRTLYVRAGKRVLDVAVSVIGLILTAPLLLAAGVAIKVSSPGPVFFRQTRVGRNGIEFQIVKLRSMCVSAESMGPAVTSSGDPRVTAIGRLVRKTKVDELPQLWNVLKGDMSLVGPRPEVPTYVGQYTLAQRKVLTSRPGLTDIASIVYRNEEELLKQSTDRERFYTEVVMQHKLDLNLQYIHRISFFYDIYLILLTLGVVLFPRSAGSDYGGMSVE